MLKIMLVLAFCKLDDCVEDEAPSKKWDSEEEKWDHEDREAGTVIGLSLTEENLEHVKWAQSATQIWTVL